MPAWRKSAGESPDLANPLNFLAMAYLATGNYAQAEKTAEESVHVLAGKVGPEDHRTGLFATEVGAGAGRREALQGSAAARRDCRSHSGKGGELGWPEADECDGASVSA